MKNYRNLVPIILILMMVVSIYTIVNDAVTQQTEVNEKIKYAQKCAEQGLYDKAASAYDEVISMDDKLDYYLTVIDMYYGAEDMYSCKDWCERTLEAYPKAVEPYERMIEYYIKDEDFAEAYVTLDECDGRKLNSKTIEKYRNKLEFLYFDGTKSFDEIKSPSSGYIGVKKNELWGLSQVTGGSAVSPKFEDIGFYANDLVAVLDNGVWYLMNAEGEYVHNVTQSVNGEITSVGLYNSDLIPICVDGVYSYYDLEFNKKFGEYDFAGAFNIGVAAVEKNGEWQIINTEGKSINNVKYDEIIVDDRGFCCQRERIFAKERDTFVLLNTDGKQIGKEEFDNAKLFSNSDYAAIEKSGLWGFIDLSGKIFIEPIYYEANSFSMNLAAVTLDGKIWGYINLKQENVIEPVYSSCTNFTSEGSAFVKKDDWEIIKLYKYNH